MKLTETQTEEIADLLICGYQCFIHKPTGKLEYHPDTTNYMFEPEPWQELIDKIEADSDNYKEIERMDSTESYNIMRDFVDIIPEGNVKIRLEYALIKAKPFRNFKHEVEHSEYRQAWFDFRLEAYINWVKKQLEDDNACT